MPSKVRPSIETKHFFVLLFSVVTSFVNAQTSSTAGAWTTNANWSTGVAPSTTSLSTNVVINKAMTFNSGSITGWGSTTITITTNGSLTVTGDLALTGSGANITIQSGGSLSVSGTTSVTNGARITVAGGATPGSASFGALAANSNGQVTISSGASANATSMTTSSNSDAIIDNQGTLTVNGNVSSSGIVTNSGTLQVNGTYTQNNSGNSTTNSGNMTVTSNVTANGQIQLNPGSTSDSNLTINGTLTVDANPWMIVGTNVSACSNTITKYANLIVKSNLILTGSGDVTVNQTGRMVVFGNITKSGGGGGNLITINCGGQVYVDGTINLGAGGGNTVTNSNGAGSPTGSNASPVIGLYVNGTVTAQNVSGTVGTRSQLQSNDLPFFTWIGNIPGSPLPIKLLSFKIDETNEDGISLSWSTSMEKDFDYFQLERAGEDLIFDEVAKISGEGGMSVITAYDYFDEHPISGKNYYRLKSVDQNGAFEYSPVIVADWTFALSNITLYPNPIKDHLFRVQFNDSKSQPTSLRVLDLSGYVVYETAVNTMSIEVVLPESVRPGIYLISILSDSGQQNIRAMIR